MSLTKNLILISLFQMCRPPPPKKKNRLHMITKIGKKLPTTNEIYWKIVLLQFLKFKSLVEEWAIFLPSSVDDVIKCHRMGNFPSMLLKLVKLLISYCGPSCLWVWLQPICAGFVRVLENLESPGILFWLFPGWKVVEQRLQVLESPGNLSKSSNKVFRIYVIRILCRL